MHFLISVIAVLSVLAVLVCPAEQKSFLAGKRGLMRNSLRTRGIPHAPSQGHHGKALPTQAPPLPTQAPLFPEESEVEGSGFWDEEDGSDRGEKRWDADEFLGSGSGDPTTNYSDWYYSDWYYGSNYYWDEPQCPETMQELYPDVVVDVQPEMKLMHIVQEAMYYLTQADQMCNERNGCSKNEKKCLLWNLEEGILDHLEENGLEQVAEDYCDQSGLGVCDVLAKPEQLETFDFDVCWSSSIDIPHGLYYKVVDYQGYLHMERPTTLANISMAIWKRLEVSDVLCNYQCSDDAKMCYFAYIYDDIIQYALDTVYWEYLEQCSIMDVCSEEAWWLYSK